MNKAYLSIIVRGLLLGLLCNWLHLTSTASILPRMCYNKHGVMVPMSGSCNGFYICLHGNAIASSCGNYLYFNAQTGVCDDPNNVRCSNGSGTLVAMPKPHFPEEIASDEEASEACMGRTNGTLLPKLDSCQHYYLCLHERAYKRSCPMLMHYNEVLKICQDPALAGCTLQQISRDAIDRCALLSNSGGMTWPHPADCQRYFGCTRRRTVEFICPRGLYYCDNKKRCEWPWNANCTTTYSQSI